MQTFFILLQHNKRKWRWNKWLKLKYQFNPKHFSYWLQSDEFWFCNDHKVSIVCAEGAWGNCWNKQWNEICNCNRICNWAIVLVFSPNKQFFPFLFLLINNKTKDKRTDTINPVWRGIFRNTTPLNVRLKIKYQVCAALSYLTMVLILFIQHFLLSGSWHVLSLFQDLKIIKFSQIFPLICFWYIFPDYLSCLVFIGLLLFFTFLASHSHSFKFRRIMEHKADARGRKEMSITKWRRIDESR